jgi:hypothetical protein
LFAKSLQTTKICLIRYALYWRRYK